MFDEVSEYELQKDHQSQYLEARSPLPWILASLFIAVAAGAVWFYLFSGRDSQQQSSATQAATAAAPATKPLGTPTDSIPLPPLDEPVQRNHESLSRTHQHGSSGSQSSR